MAHLYQKNDLWWADWSDHDGKRRRTSTGCRDEASAHIWLGQKLTETDRVRMGLIPPPLKPVKWGDAIESWRDGMTALGRDELYIEKATRRVRRLGKDLGWKVVTDAKAPRLHQWLMDIRAGHSPSTANGALYAARAFFNHAKAHGWIREIPVTTKPFANKSPKRRRALLPAELQQLLTCEAIPAERRRVYGILAYTGLRAGELAQLTWSNVDERNRIINVPASVAKSGMDEAIPVSSRVLASLLTGNTGSLLVAKIGDSLGRTYRSDLSLANISRTDGRGRVTVLHGLRHTFRSMLGAAGATTDESRALMRHADPSVTGRYMDDALLDLRAVVERIAV